jgi:hypothetical protein
MPSVDTQRPQKFKPGTKLRFVLLLDGAPQHTSKAALRASVDAGVPQLRMPPYSPDLNPTEQASTAGVHACFSRELMVMRRTSQIKCALALASSPLVSQDTRLRLRCA